MKRCTMNCNFRLPPGEGERLIVWRPLQYARLNRYEERGAAEALKRSGRRSFQMKLGDFSTNVYP